MSHNHTSGINRKLLVSIQPNIGIDGDARLSVVEVLNIYLADEAMLTMKTYRAYWHVHGPGFLDLRALFNQQCRQLNRLTNKVAERVRMLGGFAISSFEEYLHSTRLDDQPGEVPDILRLLADHEAVIRYLREDARKCLEEYEDHGSYSMLVRFLVIHEKMAWMLRSYIELEIVPDESQGTQVKSLQY
jgi:starvation-inducible DNA-binding protein